MTVTDRRPAVRHPSWCQQSSCTVDDSGFGEHVGRLSQVILAYGTEIGVGIAKDAGARRADLPRVQLQTALVGLPECGILSELQLEPAEARLLARRLIEAAVAVQAVP